MLYKKSFYIIILLSCSLSANYSVAQKRSQANDTLRIKVYTKIKYVEGRMQNIEVTKVFCDYCSPAQIEALKDQARSIIYREKRYWTKGKENKIQKFTMIIYVARDDLFAIKEDNEDNEH